MLLTKAKRRAVHAGQPRARRRSVCARLCRLPRTNGKGGERTARWAARSTMPAFLALISDQALRRIIITGRPDLGMPTYAENDGRPSDFQPLTSAEIDDLVALLADWRASEHVVPDRPAMNVSTA